MYTHSQATNDVQGGVSQASDIDRRHFHRRGDGLTPEELAFTIPIIRKRLPGRYTVPELFGDEWERIASPTDFGKSFRTSVRAEAIPGVRWVRTRSDKLHVYEVGD